MTNERVVRATPKIASQVGTFAMILTGAGLGLIMLGYLFGGTPRRFAYAYLLGYALLWSVVVGAIFFVALQHLTRAIWSVILRRAGEMVTAPMAITAALFLPIAAFAWLNSRYQLYTWLNADTVSHSEVLQSKGAYLNLPFFYIRSAVYFLIWVWYARYFLNKSLDQDKFPQKADTIRAGLRKHGAIFMPLFALTLTLGSFDWFMSLDPFWFSTIYGVYVFSGVVLVSLAVITLWTLSLKDTVLFKDTPIRDQHLYSLGALLFAFTCFWAYIAFSQYMLIWYGHLPEETTFFHHRLQGGWLKVSIILAIVRFVVPFLLLLPRRAKMNGRTLAIASWLIIGGQVLDLYWLIYPNYSPARPVFGAMEAGILLLMAGVMIGAGSRFIRSNSMVPTGDPDLQASMEFQL